MSNNLLNITSTVPTVNNSFLTPTKRITQTDQPVKRNKKISKRLSIAIDSILMDLRMNLEYLYEVNEGTIYECDYIENIDAKIIHTKQKISYYEKQLLLISLYNKLLSDYDENTEKNISEINNSEYKVRNGISVKQIPIIDERYDVLLEKPLIKYGTVAFSCNNSSSMCMMFAPNIYTGRL